MHGEDVPSRNVMIMCQSSVFKSTHVSHSHLASSHVIAQVWPCPFTVEPRHNAMETHDLRNTFSAAATDDPAVLLLVLLRV